MGVALLSLLEICLVFVLRRAPGLVLVYKEHCVDFVLKYRAESIFGVDVWLVEREDFGEIWMRCWEDCNGSQKFEFVRNAAFYVEEKVCELMLENHYAVVGGILFCTIEDSVWRGVLKNIWKIEDLKGQRV